MPREKASSVVAAVQTVFEALEPLSAEDRERVLATVRALLGLSPSTTGPSPAAGVPATRPEFSRGTAARPLSVIELMQEKSPRNNPQKIAVFAYYREKYEGQPRFARGDLLSYFSKAKEPPPANFDRDFANAVKYGWIHEDGAESYLTSKGLEAVESEFESAVEARPPSRGRSTRPKKRKKAAKPTKRR